ncbi:MAG: hypothetical protein ACIAQF_04190, partial [Phycisphaerales bacterium JB065]
MEMIATILAIVCLGTTGTTVWLLLDRSKRASRLAVAERDAEEARAEAEQFRLQIAESRESAARLTSERDEARMEAGRLGERLQSLQALHEEKLHALREATESHRKELEQRIEQIQKQFHDRFNATAAQALDQTN